MDRWEKNISSLHLVHVVHGLVKWYIWRNSSLAWDIESASISNMLLPPGCSLGHEHPVTIDQGRPSQHCTINHNLSVVTSADKQEPVSATTLLPPARADMQRQTSEAQVVCAGT
eukprot:1159057-Pelagomonas_calceolata.AAC.3